MASQVLSPLPGIFYRSPAAGELPFRNEGDRIEAGDTIGVVEVMKSFHEVKAESAGVLVRFLVESEDAVMPGEPLAEIE